jgi:hypothetical protein
MTEDAKKITDVLQSQHRAESRFWRPILAVMAAALLVVGIGFSILWFMRGDDSRRIDSLEKRNAGSEQTIAVVASDAAAARKAAEEANRRLKAAGEPTVPIPSPTTSVPPAVQAPGLTEVQVKAIVSTAIRAYQPSLTAAQVEQIARVTAPKVVRPKDGRSPTSAELQPLVANAVASYCTEDRCVGKTGANGRDAPPISDEKLSTMIDQALTAYCAQRNDCVGKDGEPGADSTIPGPIGPTGPAGPDSSAEKCASLSGELQELTVTTTDPLTQVKVLVCVLK